MFAKLFTIMTVLLFFSFSLIYAAPIIAQKPQLILSHANDLNLLGRTPSSQTGDDLLTGIIDFWYLDTKSLYEINLQVYTRHHYPTQDQLDLITVGYLRQIVQYDKDKYHYLIFGGAHIIDSGSYGGKTLQDGIHLLTGNKRFDLALSSKQKSGVGIAFKGFGDYRITLDSKLYTQLFGAYYSDASGYIYNETGVLYDWKKYIFWSAFGLSYIEPFSLPIVEFSYQTKQSAQLRYGVLYRFGDHYEVGLEGSYGGSPLGEKEDYTSYLHLKYYF